MFQACDTRSQDDSIYEILSQIVSLNTVYQNTLRRKQRPGSINVTESAIELRPDISFGIFRTPDLPRVASQLSLHTCPHFGATSAIALSTSIESSYKQHEMAIYATEIVRLDGKEEVIVYQTDH